MPGPRGAAPLLLTADPHVRAEVSRLAAAAGSSPDLTSDVARAREAWVAAPLVLIGADKVEAVATAGLARHGNVCVVAVSEPPDSLYRAALQCGATSVLTLPRAATRVVELLADVVEGAGGPGLLVAVVGGAGGVGATTFSVALAVAAAATTPTLLVDLDRLGAGADRVLGAEEAEGIRWDALARHGGRLGSRALRDALPARGSLYLLTWPVDRAFALPEPAVREVLTTALRGFAAVVVDLPRQEDATTTEVLGRCDRVLLVSTLTLTAVSAATRVADRLPRHRSHLVLRGRDAKLAVEAERLLGLPRAALMKDQSGLDEAIGLGLGPTRSPRGPLPRAARQVLAGLGAAR
jgi:secretion/DNA translocation related CpaE-like protein